MCGIAGIITKEFHDFDYSSFCTLGIANDSRGGDSCGYFIDDKYDYGVGREKYFQDFFIENEFLSSLKKSKIALLHCRKASVGLINKENAQPIVITNENGKVEFVMVHNGTIYNYEDLAKKYIPNTDIKGMTDSKVLAHILYHGHYSVLNEYYGGTAFVAVDYREGSPRVFLYHGSSKRTEYSAESEIERPLYFCYDKIKQELIFSSVYPYLEAIRKDLSAYSLKDNILWEFCGDGFIAIKKYTRDKVYQSKPVAHSRCLNYYGYDYGYDYGYNYNTYNTYQYIRLDIDKNIYELNNKPAHGKLIISNYGTVYKKALDTFATVWFFNGIALKSEACFNFLVSYSKHYKGSIEEFYDSHENIVRYFGLNNIYLGKDKLYYIAKSLNEGELFTGNMSFITDRRLVKIQDGKKISTNYSGEIVDIKSLLVPNDSINFKLIKKNVRNK